MDLEEMKNQWSTLNSSNNNIETSINDKKFDKMKTAQQQLITRSRTFAGLAGSFVILSFVILMRMGVSLWLALGVEAFFGISAIMDFTLQRKIGEIDLGTMTVTEVAQKAAACRRLHHIFQMILIPMAIVLMGFLAYTMTDDKAFIYGMGVGTAIGLVFGIKTYFKMMDYYKTLIND